MKTRAVDGKRRGLGLLAGAVFAAFGLGLAAAVLYAAVGCDLNDPDRDVKRLFPDSTGYKTLYVSISKKGGDDLLKQDRGPAGRPVHRPLRDRRRALHHVRDLQGRGPRRLHPRGQPEGDVRRAPGLPGPRPRGRDQRLLLPEADLQGGQGLPRARLRRPVRRPQPGGFLQVRRRYGRGRTGRARSAGSRTRTRPPRRTSGRPSGRPRRTSSSSTNSFSGIRISSFSKVRIP